MKQLKVTVLTVLVAIAAGCGPAKHEGIPTRDSNEANENGGVPGDIDPDQVGFADVQRTVFTAGRCLRCHSEFSTYEGLMASSLVVPGDSSASPLFRAVASGAMPPSGPLPGEIVEVLNQWIAGGAIP